MHRDVRGTVGKRRPYQLGDDLGHGVGGGGTRGTEWAELDAGPDCLGSSYGSRDVRAGLTLDERLDGEFKLQHTANLRRKQADRNQRAPITRCRSCERNTQSCPAASNA